MRQTLVRRKRALMDAQAVFGVIAAVSTVLGFGIVIGRTRTLSGTVLSDLKALDSKLHRLASWKDGLPRELSEVYVPRKELALELKPIHDALKRIEDKLA